VNLPVSTQYAPSIFKHLQYGWSKIHSIRQRCYNDSRCLHKRAPLYIYIAMEKRHGKTIESIACVWVNYNNSFTWILRPFWDDSPNINHDFQWGRPVRSWSNLPRCLVSIIHDIDSIDHGFPCHWWPHCHKKNTPLGCKSWIPCKKINSLLVNVDIPIHTKRLVRIKIQI